MTLALAAMILLALLATACAGAAFARTRGRPRAADVAALIDRIDALLPQTQCARCGYPACRPYAQAVACGDAPINRCPPAGEAGIRALAALTGQLMQPLDPECGEEMPARVAIIDEDICIGCTKCIQACPVDAIIGAAKLMHTIILQRCTGCELCIPPCPVDCIALVPARANGRDFARPSFPYAA